MVAMASSTPDRICIAFGLCERFVDTARDGEIWVNAPAAQDGDDLLAEFAQVDCFKSQLGVGADQTDHIADGRIGIKTEQQVGTGQFEEMHAMALDDLTHVHQLAQQGGRAGWWAADKAHRRLWRKPDDG